MNVDAYKSALKTLLGEATGQAASAFDDFANEKGPMLARMAAQGATEEDFAEFADAAFGRLCVNGINVQAAVERTGVTVAKVFLAAGRKAIGLP
jgi:hypothetical protein